MLKYYISFVLLLITSSLQAQVESELYERVIDATIDRTVPTVSVDQLLKFDYSSFVFLDTRAKEEFEQSRIKNAHWVGYDNFKNKRLPEMSKSDTIVLYCSIGYRSEKIGERLQKLGYTDVYNLYGGIFEWVNRDLPVYNQSNVKTDTVHAYSVGWGIWLNKGVKVYE
ncbi:MAG: rhodanese-like domain-containing protein [Bacteroidia bacterium]|nr:rhodanese-like domain-containing protein [Bacteroidia bacterium]NNC84594.1 rhodanese-like domain-containing protein [Bacteroidia bacterium]